VRESPDQHGKLKRKQARLGGKGVKTILLRVTAVNRAADPTATIEQNHEGTRGKLVMLRTRPCCP